VLLFEMRLSYYSDFTVVTYKIGGE